MGVIKIPIYGKQVFWDHLVSLFVSFSREILSFPSPAQKPQGILGTTFYNCHVNLFVLCVWWLTRTRKSFSLSSDIAYGFTW